MKITGPVLAVGAMSGTSLDGVDAAAVLTDGERIHGFGATGYRPYSEAEREVIRAALGRWPGEPGVAEAAEVVETAHAELLARFPQAELIGFHGQTLAHEPRGRGTHQAGNGAVLAGVLERAVVWDFRAADVALGGEGAPLAPFFHFALARWIGEAEPVAFLNLGGVGNITWLDPCAEGPEAEGALLAFDTGPANAPLDDFLRARLGLARDEGGALAAEGEPDSGILERFLSSSFFARIPPKSLDRNEFGWLVDSVSALAPADAAATLAAAAALSVGEALRHFPGPLSRVLVSGGGRHNRTLMAMIEASLDVPVLPVEAVGLDGDMLEAQAFAHLAVRVARGLPTSAPGTTGVAAPVSGGVISKPRGQEERGLRQGPAARVSGPE